MEIPANTPIVVLRELTGQQRLLPIVIGHPEAAAISAALEGVTPPRPMTHDLMVTLLDAASQRVEQVVITEVVDHTFYAEIHLTGPTGQHHVSCRPSDGLAIAVRIGCPLRATAALLDTAGIAAAPEAQADVDVEAAVGEFRKLLDDITPDDFSQ